MNKTIFITGAAKRIGKSIALTFKDLGWNIIIHYNSSKKDAEELANEINKVRLPYNSNSISQIAAAELLKNFSIVQKQIDSIKDERIRLLEEFTKIKSINAFPSDANFILFQTCDNGEKVFKSLLENDILVRNLGTHPMLKNCLRVTIGTQEENDQFLDRLKHAIK